MTTPRASPGCMAVSLTFRTAGRDSEDGRLADPEGNASSAIRLPWPIIGTVVRSSL
jgi:hypothetical protein